MQYITSKRYVVIVFTINNNNCVFIKRIIIYISIGKKYAPTYTISVIVYLSENEIICNITKKRRSSLCAFQIIIGISKQISQNFNVSQFGHNHHFYHHQLTIILLITTIVVFNLLLSRLLLGMKCVSMHQDLQIFVLKLNKYE